MEIFLKPTPGNERFLLFLCIVYVSIEIIFALLDTLNDSCCMFII